MKPRDTESIEALQKEQTKLKKINAALMSRVERSIDQQFNAFSLFETAIALDHQVLSRTRQLQDALRAIERSNDYLYRAKQRAEAASSLKSSVLISVTHDLLQPLNAARLTLSTFAESGNSSRGAALIEQIDQSLLTLEDMLKTLLDISKLDAGVLKPEARPVSISSLFDPLRNELAPLAAKRGLSLKIRPSALAVVSDPLMLRRILQNLLTNALRYTQRGGVLMGCRRRGGDIAIEVHDTGPGIPEAQRQAIFQEFRRGEADSGDAGFGLGLSIVRRFATVLGHDIQLASRVGYGSTFSVTLPRTELQACSTTGYEPPSGDFQFSGLEGAKILIVEDDSSGAQAMALLLEKWGCDVARAVSTTDALERIGTHGSMPDAIIVDLRTDGGENGLAATDAMLRRPGSDPPVIIVTADCSAEAAREAALRGYELLEKPVKPAEMRSLLSFLLA